MLRNVSFRFQSKRILLPLYSKQLFSNLTPQTSYHTSSRIICFSLSFTLLSSILSWYVLSSEQRAAAIVSKASDTSKRKATFSSSADIYIVQSAKEKWKHSVLSATIDWSVFGKFCANTIRSNATAVPRGHKQHFDRPCLLLSINIMRIVPSSSHSTGPKIVTQTYVEH